MGETAPPPDRRRDGVLADLARCGLLTDASPTDLARLASVLSPEEARPGAVLMRNGEAAEHFLWLTSGSVRVEVGEDLERKVFVVPEGSILGEIALLRGTAHRAAVTALTDVRFLVGGRSAFLLLLGIPGVRDRVVRQARQRLAADLSPVRLALRDGTTVRLRPVVPDDRRPVLKGAVRSSANTLYRRFLRPGWPSQRELRHLTDADYVDHFAWVALDRADVPVGEASFFRSATDRTEAEISFWLPDDIQGRGLGTLLMGALAVAARHNGITRFVAEVLADNAAMRAILGRAGVRWEPEECGVAHGVAPVPDPGRFGIDPGTAAALEAQIDEVSMSIPAELRPAGDPGARRVES